MTVLFAMMFKWLPDVSVAWRDVWLGAFITALFFEVGKAAIGFYIGKQSLEIDLRGGGLDRCGADLGLLHVAEIILMGAEVTHAYAKHEGSIRQRQSRDGRENVRPLSAGSPSGSARRVL